MKNIQTDIDTGNNILYIEHEVGRRSIIFTCYINSLSVRSGSLHLPRIRDVFIDAVVTACAGAVEDEDRVADSVLAYIEETLSELATRP